MDAARERLSELWESIDSRARAALSRSLLLPGALLHALGLSPFITQTLKRHPGFLGKMDDSTLMLRPSRRALTVGLSADF